MDNQQWQQRSKKTKKKLLLGFIICKTLNYKALKITLNYKALKRTLFKGGLWNACNDFNGSK